MTSTMIISLMITHGIFDWLLQDRETAKNKSSKFKFLAGHLFIIYFGLLLWGLLFGKLYFHDSFLFALSNTILHGIIDWNIWKLYKYLAIKRYPDIDQNFPYWEDSWFYNFIMLDQLLHGVCYIVIYDLLR